MKFLSRFDDFESIIVDGDVQSSGLSSLYIKDTNNAILRIGSTTGDSFITYDGSELSISSDVDLRLTTPTDQDVFLITSSGNISTTAGGGTFTIGGGLTLSNFGAGYLKTDANGVVSIDTDIIEDTLDSVTDRGNTTTNDISVGAVTATDYRSSGTLYLTSGDDWRLRSTGGTERMRVTSAGNVGIGTTSPSTKFHVLSGTLNSAVATFSGANLDRGLKISTFNSGNNDGGVILDAQVALGVLTFATVGSEHMRITSAGNVGIGTSSPNSKLEVVSAITFSSVDTFGQFVIKSATGTTGDLLNFGVDSTNGLAFIQANDRGTATIPLSLQRYGGNVGIGTTSPSQKLDVANGGIGFSGTGLNATDKKIYSPADGVLEWMTHNSAGEHGFAVSHQGSKKVFLNTSGNSYLIGGNVGIGTTNPVQKLQVDGNIYSNGGNIYVNTGKGLYAVGELTLNSNNGSNYVQGIKLNTNGTLVFTQYGAGLLQTDANGVVSLDTTAYLPSSSYVAPAIEAGGGTPALATGVTAAEIRTLIDVDVAGTDNSTNVTLAGSYDYLTLSGQEITLGQVDYSTDITNLPTLGTAAAADTTDFAAASHNHDGVYLKVNGTGNDFRFQLNLGNLSGITRWYKVATVNTGSGGLHIRGLITNHVESFASQKVDIAIQGREANNADEIEINGGFDVFYQGCGIRVVEGTKPGSYQYWDVYVKATNYTQCQLDLTGVSVTFTTDNSYVTTEPGTVVELDTSSYSEGSYIIQDSNVRTNFHSGNTTIPVSGTDFDPVGTDNSTNVTLAAVTGNYLTISGQEITAGTVPISLGGTGATTAADARTNLGVDPAGTDNSTNVTLVTTSHDYLSISGQAITLDAINLDDINGGSTAGILKTDASGVLSIDTSTYLTAEADTLQSVTTRGSSTSTSISTNGGKLVLRDDSIENHVTNGNAAVVFNYYGYATGTTQFRDTIFYNGKNSAVMFVDGSASSVGIGTTNPTTLLNIEKSISGTGLGDGILFKLKNTSTTNDTRSGISFGHIDGIGSNLVMQSAILKNSTTGEYDMAWDLYGGSAGWKEGLLYLDSNPGNVGIGTSIPSEKLDVNGKIRLRDGGNTTVPSIQMNSGGTMGFSNPSNQDISIITASTTKVFIKQDGNVGIGTTNPTSKLQVNGQFRQIYAQTFISNPLDSDGYAGHIIVNSDGTSAGTNGNLSGIGMYTNSSYHAAAGLFALQESEYAASMVFYAGSNLATERMRITSGGSVGIGTASGITTSTYTGKLAVYTASGANLVLAAGTNTNNAIVSRIIGVNNNNGNSGNEGAAAFYGVTSIESAITTSDSNAGQDSGGYIMFKTKPEAGALAEAMRIAAAGNVGIGTTSPQATLHVGSTGTNAYSSTITNGSNMKGIKTTLSNNADDMVGIYFATGTNTQGTHWSGITGSRSNSASDWSTQLNFYTHDENTSNINDATQKMVIKGSGNVGIGTTSPSTNLHVAGSVRVTGDRIDVNSNTRITGAYYENSGTEYTYIDMYNGGNASINIGTKHPLSYISFESGSGAYTERMRITNTGNVGIGTTNPLQTLHVSGQRILVDATNAGIMFRTGGVNRYSVASVDGDFQVYDEVNSLNRFYITSAGNVGIGTASPATKLHVVGTAETRLRVGSSNASSNVVLELRDENTPTGQGTVITYNNATGETYFNNALSTATTDFHFQSGEYGSASDFFTLSNAGGNSIVQMSTSTGDAFITYEGATNEMAIASDGDLRLTTPTDQDVFFISSGGNIDMTQAGGNVDMGGNLTLDGNITGNGNAYITGNVGIGATSPTEKLEIQSGAASNLLAKISQTNASYQAWWQATSQDGKYINIGVSNNADNYSYINTSKGGLRFLMSSAIKMTLTSGGSLGIGTTSPQQALHIKGATSAYIMLEADSDTGTVGTYYKSEDTDDTMNRTKGFFGWQGQTAYGNGYFTMWLDTVEDNGAVTSSEEKFRWERDGDFHADGDVIAYSTTTPSDERLKDNIKTIENASEKIAKMRGVEYQWNTGKLTGKKEIGLIAQEVEAVIPEVVAEKKLPMLTGTDEVYKTVDYERLVALLIESNKELQNRITELESKVYGTSR